MTSKAARTIAFALLVASLASCTSGPKPPAHKCVVHSVGKDNPGLVECSPEPAARAAG